MNEDRAAISTSNSAYGRLASADDRGTVLLVEDDDPVREIAEQMLRFAGFAVISVSGGEGALTLAKKGVEFDLLVTDINMPGKLDGLKLAAEIQEIRPEIPVLYTSGFSEEMLKNSGKGGAAAFLCKPYSVSELEAKLSQMTSIDSPA